MRPEEFLEMRKPPRKFAKLPLPRVGYMNLGGRREIAVDRKVIDLF